MAGATKEQFEKLFRFDGGYIYIQYTADDPEYDFDYTVYDNDFNDIDGGVVGENGEFPNLIAAAAEVIGAPNFLIEVSLSTYRKQYPFI